MAAVHSMLALSYHLCSFSFIFGYRSMEITITVVCCFMHC